MKKATFNHMKRIKKHTLIGHKYIKKVIKLSGGGKFMYHHFILLHSDYNEGRRIAYHQVDTSIKELDNFFLSVDYLKGKFPHLSFGFHHLQTESKDWQSIVEYDMFFNDVFPVAGLDAFTKLISGDEQVSALDLANLITSKISCTHLKLQKLLFFFYSAYIEKYNAKPFPEKFLAWDYGPVVPEVYDVYKTYGRDSIRHKEDNSIQIMKREDFKLSVYSRFKKIPTYIDILEILDEMLNEYGDKSAEELVAITHQKDSPWDKVFNQGEGRNDIIEIQ